MTSRRPHNRRNRREDALSQSFDLGSLIEEFRDEARDQVDRLDAALIRLEREGGLDDEPRTALLRTLHTLKGNAGMLGLSEIRDFVHVLENVLKAESREWPEALVERLFEGAAALRRAVDVAGSEDQAPAFQELTAARHRIEELGSAEPDAAPRPTHDGVEEAAAGGGVDRLRIPFPKLDSLLNQVGELVGETDALRSRLSDAAVDRSMLDLAESIGRRSEALRESVMGLRLVPLGRVLSRFHSLVRRLARDQGKEARLVVEGEETEVDKSTADALAEPLLHLLRNAIDHGIQPPDQREADGKPRYGTIRVAASQEGDRVRIAVEDDGAGLDLSRIRDRARDAGLVARDADPSKERLLELVFRAGFSTRSAVSTVSGQGVGLDVVRRSVRDLRGELEVERSGGEGTSFAMRLPLTVALVPSLVFETAGQVLAVPVSSVDRTLRLDRVERVGAVDVIRSDEGLHPVADLDRVFEWEPVDRGEFGVLVRHGDRRLVLSAARLVDRRDLVVKALPSYGPRPNVVSGASVLAGGAVILLLDPVALIERHADPPGGGRR